VRKKQLNRCVKIGKKQKKGQLGDFHNFIDQQQ